MLDTSVRNLRDEFQAACEHRQEYLASEQDIIDGYAGGYFRGTGFTSSNPINHAYEQVALFSGQVVSQIPRMRATSHAGPEGEIQAKANQDGTNRWIRKSDFKGFLRDLVPEFCFTWAVGVVSMTPVPGTQEFDDPPMWPNVQPVPKDRFFWDPLALTWTSCRYQGHQCVADISDLIEIGKSDPSSGWNVALLESLQGDTGTDSFKRPDVGVPTRNELVWYEAWVPEVTLPGFENDPTVHGTIYTIPVASAGMGDEPEEWLRPPRPFYGPAWGPYTVFRAHKVPGHIAALGPVTATMPQAVEANLHAVAVATSSRRKKSFTVYDGLSPADEKALMEVEDGGQLRIPGFDKDKMLQVENGGPTAEQLNLLGIFIGQLQRAAGQLPAQVGTVTGAATATENGIAADASGARTQDLADRFMDGANQVMRTVSWYIYNTPECVFRTEDGSLYMGGNDLMRSIEIAVKSKLLPMEQAATLLAVIHSGAFKEPEKIPWEELDVEIEAYSMQRTSEAVQQRRLTEGSAAIIQALPLMMQFPWFNWKAWLNQLGEALNWPGLGELVNFEAMQAMALAQMMAQQQVAAAQPQPGAPSASKAPAGPRPTGPQRMPPPSNVSKGASEGAKRAAQSREREAVGAAA